MKNIITIYKILTKNTEMRIPKKGNKALIYLSLGIIASVCIMLPCCGIVGFISYCMALALENQSMQSAGLLAEIHIMSAISMVFGILVIFNILFFSSDREHIMPLPFKGYEILTGKFLYSFLAESIMEFLVLISMFAGYFIAVKPNLISVISALIAVILIPLLPMIYCVLLSLIVFGLLKGIHNSKLINHISTIIMLCFIALFLYSFKDMNGITVDNYVASLSNNSNSFSLVLNKIFFTVPILLKAIENNDILSLIIYIFLNCVMFFVMILVGSFLYQPCLYAVGALGNSKKKYKHKTLIYKQKSQFSAYILKEFKVILRTKAYANNCFWINLIWPLGLCLYFYLNRNKDIFHRLLYAYQSKSSNAYVVIAIILVFASFIACAMNSVASTSFTREGQHLSLIKYIPISYKKQMYAKEFMSLIITYPPILATVIIFGIVFKINFVYYIYYGVLSLLCIIITTITGLLLDSAAPHSSWDDEYSALRGNLNTFFDMAIIMIISLLLCAFCFILYNYFNLSITVFHILLMTISFIIAIILFIFGNNKIIENMDEL